MSVNLDNVKAIVHNNKNVVKIEDSHGIVWQAPPSEEWHTVWTGSILQDCSGTSSSGYISYKNVVNPGLTGVHKVRATFDIVYAYASGTAARTEYYINGTQVSAPATPYTLECEIDFDHTYGSDYAASQEFIMTYGFAGSITTGYDIKISYLTYNPTNGIRLAGYYRTGGSGSVTAYLRITQVDILY